MNILLVLIPLSLLFLIAAGVALFWAVDNGQFDDMDTPRLLPLTDRDDAPDADAHGTQMAPAGRVRP